MEERKLKILYISSWYPNKYRPFLGVFVQRQAAATAQLCDASVIYIYSAEKAELIETTEEVVYTIRVYFKKPANDIPLISHIQRLWRYLSAWRKAVKLYKSKKGKPDLINSNIVYPASIVAACLSMAWHIPYIITEHWSGYFPEHGRYKGFIRKIISRMAVANAKAVITPSDILGKTMLSLGLKNRYFTISNVVDVAQYNVKLPEHKADDYFNFLHISSLSGEKNVPGIIRAFKKFHASNPHSKLTIIWDEDVKELLGEIKEPFSEEEGIFLQGRQEITEVAASLQKADAFVLFSRFESQSIVLLEALCCGIPVISSKCRGPEEFIMPRNGLLVDVDREDQLAEAMELMVKNRDTYNATEIRNFVVNKVSKESVAKKLIQLYKDVLKENVSEK